MNGLQKRGRDLIRLCRNKITSSPVGHRLLHGAFWSISGNSLARCVGVVTTMLVTRILGKETYGQVSIIQNTVDMFAIAGGLGLSITATKHVAEYRESDPAKTGRIIAMALMVSLLSGAGFMLLLIICAPWIATTSLHAAGMTGVLRLGAGLLFFATVNSALVGSLTGFEAFKARAKVNVAAGLFGLPVTLAGAYWGGRMGTICGFLGAACFLATLNSLVLKHKARLAGVILTWKEWYLEAPLILKFGIPAMASSLITTPVDWFCVTLLVREGGGFQELGVYNAANQWFSAIMFLPSVLSVVSIPILSDLIGKKQWDVVGRLTWKSVRLHSLVIIPTLALAIASPWIMRAYGPGFEVGVPVMILHLATAFIVALHAPVWPVLLTAGKLRAVILMNLGWALAFISLAWFGVRWGAEGLAAARLCAYFFYVLGIFYLFHRFVRNGMMLAQRPVQAST